MKALLLILGGQRRCGRGFLLSRGIGEVRWRRRLAGGPAGMGAGGGLRPRAQASGGFGGPSEGLPEWQRMATTSVAPAMSCLVTNPLEVAKVRQQMAGELGAAIGAGGIRTNRSAARPSGPR